jgi:hypothetical protein
MLIHNSTYYQQMAKVASLITALSVISLRNELSELLSGELEQRVYVRNLQCWGSCASGRIRVKGFIGLAK